MAVDEQAFCQRIRYPAALVCTIFFAVRLANSSGAFLLAAEWTCEQANRRGKPATMDECWGLGVTTAAAATTRRLPASASHTTRAPQWHRRRCRRSKARPGRAVQRAGR